MKILRLISRIIAGSVFIFSGTVKAIDPLGSAYKFHDYFQAFHLDFLQFMSLPFAIILCTAEFITGFSVLTGFRQKAGTWGITILIIFFTPLTLFLALTNPVSDCGCFGDAIHLTNWQTFLKNIVLLIFILLLFAGRKRIMNIFKPAAEWIIVGAVALLFVLFSVFNLIYLPLIDFLPYNTGTNIREKMKIPEGAPSDQYATTFIYEKDGNRKEFTLDNYPAGDTTWKFIDQKSILVKKGYHPPVHDFSITTLNKENITDSVLNDPGFTILMVSKKLGKANQSLLKRGFNAGRLCLSKGIEFIVLTSSGSDEIKNYSNGIKFCVTDETTLKTMVRSDPGYILLRKGSIVGKWSWANFPEDEHLINYVTGLKPEKLNFRNGYLIITISFLSLALFLTILCILLKKTYTQTK
jgi:hypothetical protein